MAVWRRHPSNIRDLEQFAKEEWSKIPAEHCKKLIDGYRKRAEQSTPEPWLKIRRGRLVMKMGGAAADRRRPFDLTSSYIGGLSTALQNAVDKSLMPVGEEDFGENKESSGNGRKSPSVFDLMISDVKEKSQQQDTKDDSILKSPEIRDDHEKIKQTNKQLDHLKNLTATMELGRSHSNRDRILQMKSHRNGSQAGRPIQVVGGSPTSVRKPLEDVTVVLAGLH
ncbi:unnamed protein product, partial [Ranitomeya imitator]